MLQLIRDRAQGWIAWVIVILICVPFALWGVQEYLGVDPNIPVAEVNGEEIGLQRFTVAYQRTQAQMRGLTGDPDIDQRLKTDTIERMVRDELIVQAAANQGLRVSDEQLAFAIQAQAAFQQDGRFSQLAYESFVRNQGFSPGGFEFQYRRTLIADQVFSALSDTAFATSLEATRVAALQDQKRTFSTLKLSPERFADIEVSDAELKAHFEENKTAYRSPEQVKVRYVVLSKRGLAAEIGAEDDALRGLYESRKAAYTTPEQRKVRHILIRVAADADDAARAAARGRIDELRTRIDGGEDFAVVAKEASEDPSSAERGGDLGSFGRGVMDPEFERAAFEQPVGVLGEPILSSFGFHLIRVDESSGGKVPSFDEVRADVLADYREGEAERLYYEQADRLQNLSYEQPDNLDVVSETLGLEIVETGFMDRSGLPGDAIASNPAFVRAAFSEDVLGAGNNSDPVEIDEGSVVVLRVFEHNPSAERSLDEVREQVTEAVRSTKASEATETLGKSLLKKLRTAGATEEAIAAEVGVEWQSHESAGRTETGSGAQAVALAFRMPRPADGGATYDGIATGGGEFFLVALKAVETSKADGGDAAEALRNRVTAGIQQNSGQADFQSLMTSFRDSADVSIFEDRL